MKKVLLCLLLIISCLSACASGNVQFDYTNDSDDGLWQYSQIASQSFDIETSKTMSIQFWIKPTTNKTGSTIFTLRNNNGDYVNLTSSGYNEGIYSGLTLNDSKDQWAVADGENTISTYRYNLITIMFNNDEVNVALNNQLIIEQGKISLPTGKCTFSLGEITGFISDLVITNNKISFDEAANLYDSKETSVLLDTVNFSDADDQVDDLWLVDNEIDGIPVTYTVDNQDVMSFQGKITKPQQDSLVTLTASMYTDKSEATKQFEINVLADSDETFIKRDAKALDNDIDGVMHSNTLLPTDEVYGSTVSYEVTSGNAYVEDNYLIKDSEEEKVNITLSAVLTLNDQKIEKEYNIVLLDSIAGYIMSYFNGETVEGEERGKLAYSIDGLNWETLNGGEPIITSELGNGRIRDPFITRDKDGNFVVLATEGFDNPYIYIIQSKDLIDLSNQQLVQVSYYDAGLQMTGTRAWAPEMTYDNDNDTYYIYFSDIGFNTGSDQNTGHIYTVSSKDLNDFSYPYTFYDPGYTVIDGTVFNLDGKYWLFYKDERKAAQTIFYASSSDINKGFGQAYDGEFLLTKKYMEGPFTFLSKDGKTHYLYIDNYPNGKFYVATFTTLGKNNDITWLSEDSYTLPEDDVRHGSCIPVTQKELNKLIEAYK